MTYFPLIKKKKWFDKLMKDLRSLQNNILKVYFKKGKYKCVFILKI